MMNRPIARPARLRPLPVFVSACVVLVVGWLGLEAYFAYTARPNSTVDYMEQFRGHAESVQGEGPNAWDHIGDICADYAEALDAFRADRTPFGDLSRRAIGWIDADPSLLWFDREVPAGYYKQMESDGMDAAQAEALLEQARGLYVQWLKGWFAGPEWDRVMQIRQITRAVPEFHDADEMRSGAIDRGIAARKLSLGLRARLVVAATEQDWEAYVACYDTLLAVRWSLAVQPILLQRLVASSIERSVMSCVSMDAASGILPDDVIALIKASNQRWAMPDRMHTVRGERLFMLDQVQRYHDRRGRRILGGPHAMPEVDPSGYGVNRPPAYRNMLSVLSPRHAEIVRQADAVFADVERHAASPLWQQHERFHSPEFQAILGAAEQDLLETLDVVVSPLVLTLTELCAVGCDVELALAGYRHAHGKLPDAIDQLVPEYLGTIPVDPFSRSGEPLRYARGEWTTLEGGPGGEYIIYSVGYDGADDGGKPPPQAMSNALKPGYAGTDYILNDPNWR